MNTTHFVKGTSNKSEKPSTSSKNNELGMNALELSQFSKEKKQNIGTKLLDFSHSFFFIIYDVDDGTESVCSSPSVFETSSLFDRSSFQPENLYAQEIRSLQFPSERFSTEVWQKLNVIYM